MKNLILKPTSSTPLVEFITTGNLSITGSLYPEDAKEYFQPLMEWVMNLRAKQVMIRLRFDYLNSACSKKLFELFQRLMNNENVETIHTEWYYQKGDEDAFETGQLLLETLPSLHFKLIEFDTQN